MNLKYQLINSLISKFGLTSYLEIGLGPLQETWRFIEIDHKVCVDVIKVSEDLPTFLGGSDDFFKINEDKFDLIYIDGDHNSEQVRKDVSNSLGFLSDNGIIVMHDIAPSSRGETSHRSSGDAYKIFIEIRRNPHLKACTYFFSNGDAVGVVWRGKNENPFTKIDRDDQYSLYEEFRDEILQPSDFDSIVKGLS
jgi:hypothetical protein